MTFETPARDIGDTIVIMFFLRSDLVMTNITIDAGARSIMAVRTSPISITMIHGEIMPIDIDVIPSVGVMTLRTLPWPVI